MNVKKKYLVLCLAWICYNWVMCYANLCKSDDHQVDAPLLPKHIEKNKCDVSNLTTADYSKLCSYDWENDWNSTSTKGCPTIFTVHKIVKNILIGIDSSLKIVHNNFESAAIIKELVDPSAHASYDKIFKEYAILKNIVNVLMNLFYNVFNMNIDKKKINLIESMPELSNATMHLLSSLPNVKSPDVQNLRNLIGNIYKKIASILNVSINNGMNFDNYKSQLINRTISIFDWKSESWPTRKCERNLRKNMLQEFISILGKISNGENLKNFISQLKEKTIKLLRKYRIKSSGMTILEDRIENIRNYINSIMGKNLTLSDISGTGFNWEKPFNSLKISLQYVKNIPMYIVQIFNSITKKTLMSSNIDKNHWKRIKTHPLFVAQCCSSKIDKLWNISRFGISTMFNLMPNFWKRKQKLLSPWHNLKNKLLDKCRFN